jgi:hypothetical protein
MTRINEILLFMNSDWYDRLGQVTLMPENR